MLVPKIPLVLAIGSMYRSKCALSILVLLIGCWDLAIADDVHIYLLGGQSNGTGRGDAAEIQDDTLSQPQRDAKFWYRKTQNSATNNALPENELIDLAPGSGHGVVGVVMPVEFGPEISIGRELADSLPGQNIMLIKGTRAGSNLHTHWAQDGLHYNNFLQTIGEAIAQIQANGDQPVFKGMFWVQGEADANDLDNALDYEANLTDLLRRVRDDLFDGRNASFVLSQISDNQYASLGSGQLAVRAGQASVAATDARTIMVATDDDELFTTRADIIHFDGDGLINLGRMMGQAMVNLETLGDVNCDGVVNLLDVEPFINLITSGQYGVKADINQDGTVDLLDVAPFIELF